MHDQTGCRREVKDTPHPMGVRCPGEFTAEEIGAMRAKADFWVAVTLREEDPEPDASN